MMRSNSGYISLLTAQYNLLIVQICWSPRGTSRQLIFDDDDDDEEELRHPFPLRMSQEQTAIFVTIDCRGGLPHATNVW